MACWAAGRSRERCFPTASIDGLMSLMVMWTFGFAFTTCDWCSMRKAMSPVPPATSRMRCGAGGMLEEWPGLSEETKWSLFFSRDQVSYCCGVDVGGRLKTYFQIRCQPKDIRSFMRSYDSATLWKTPATRSVFSDSDRPSWNPKCVVCAPSPCLLLSCVGGDGAADVVLGRRTGALVLKVRGFVAMRRAAQREWELHVDAIRPALRTTGRVAMTGAGFGSRRGVCVGMRREQSRNLRMDGKHLVSMK